MSLLKRLIALCYMLLMTAVGSLLVLAAFGLLPAEVWQNMITAVNGTVAYKAAAAAIGGILILIGIAAPLRLASRLNRSRMVAFQNPDGEVTVSLSAIEDYILKVAKSVQGIRDVRSRVSINRRGINIKTDLSVSSGTNIPQITERIQTEVKSKVKSMLGVEESINMKIHVRKITSRGARGEEEGHTEDSHPSLTRIPYRSEE